MSGWLVTHMNGFHAMHGWQWMFIVQGLPPSVLGIAAFFYLDNSRKKRSG